MTVLDFISLGRIDTVCFLSQPSVVWISLLWHLDFAFHSYLRTPQSCVIMVFVSGWGWNIYTPLSKQSVTVSHYHTCLWASGRQPCWELVLVHCWRLPGNVSAPAAWVKQTSHWLTSRAGSKSRSSRRATWSCLAGSHGCLGPCGLLAGRPDVPRGGWWRPVCRTTAQGQFWV